MSELSEKELLDEIFKDCFAQIQNIVPIENEKYKGLDTAIEICYRRILKLIQNQPEKRYKAKISDKTTIKFYLSDLVDRNDSFTMRLLVLPWLLKGNKPELIKED